MNWDDMRVVLAIFRGGSLAAAARELGVNTSSVYRRLETLEAGLEVRLFERLRSGYRLTEAGEALAETAQGMESAVLDVERRVKGTDLRLEGHIRLSTSEGLAFYVLPAYLAEFRASYPGLSLTVSANNQLVDLTRRDADIVVRGTTKPPDHLVGQSVGRIGFACYATPGYLDRQGRGRPLADYDWIGFDGHMLRVAQAVWLNERVPESGQHLRFDSFGAVFEAVVAGVGCGTLACFSADDDPRLERLPGTYVLSDIQVWVLTHPDLRKSARIRACRKFFVTQLTAEKDRLLGRSDEDKKLVKANRK